MFIVQMFNVGAYFSTSYIDKNALILEAGLKWNLMSLLRFSSEFRMCSVLLRTIESFWGCVFFFFFYIKPKKTLAYQLCVCKELCQIVTHLYRVVSSLWNYYKFWNTLYFNDANTE